MTSKYAEVRFVVNVALVLSIVLAATFSTAFYAFTVGPMREAVRARSWIAVNAVIKAVTNNSDDGYECEFSYRVAGRDYVSSQQAVKALKVVSTPRRVGEVVTCYADPADPAIAVLDRDAPFEFDDGVLLAVVLATWAFVVKSLLVRFSLVRVRVDVRTRERLTYREMAGRRGGQPG